MARFNELRLAAFQQAEREQRRRVLEHSRGLRMSGAVAALAGFVTFLIALWFKEGGPIIAATVVLTLVGMLAMRTRPSSEPEIRRSAEELLAAALSTYLGNQLASPDFFHSEGWQALRKWTLERADARCLRCGRKGSAMLVVEHIIPRSEAPARALDPANVQIICYGCRQARSAATGSD